MTTTTAAATPELTPTSQLLLPAGVEIGAFDSSSQEQRFRVELPDGRHFQINERLYQLLDLLRSPATLSELAARFHERTAAQIEPAQLATLCTQLLSQGLVSVVGVVQPVMTPVTPKAYLGMHFRRTILSTARLAPLARLFQGFFRWPLAAPVVTILVIAHVLAYRALSMQPDLKLELFTGPLLTICLLFSIVLHELGHVAACHRWNCPHGPLGFGLYFSMPVFYVDVTQAWRLTRRQRAAVDIGGVYIQMLCVPLALLLYYWTGNATFLMVIVAIDMLVLYNFEPFMKLDGYWLLSDLTGVPNLHTRTQEAARQSLQRLWQRLARRPRTTVAAPFAQWPRWVRTIIWVYLALSTIVWPLFMIFWLPTLWQALLAYPALVQTAVVALFTAAGQGDIGGVFTQLGALFMPTLILVGLGFELKRLGGRLVAAWQQRRQRATPTVTAPAAA
jgi:putative peptide zinc metalloprotease protein